MTWRLRRCNFSVSCLRSRYCAPTSYGTVFYLDAMWSILVALVVPADSSVKQSKPTKRHIAFPAGCFPLSWK